MSEAARPIRRLTFLGAGVVATAAIAALPLISVGVLALGDSGGTWQHLIVNVLPASMLTTLILVFGIGLASAIIGVSCAWLVSRYSFAGRDALHWILVLPLAIPTYVAAYCYVELLDYTGPVQSAIRSIGGFQSRNEYFFPEIRSLPGAIFIMSLVLYPYVYLTTRLMFSMQGATVIETARILGANGMRLFLSVAVPLARPAMIAGATLAMMEALNDIGAVEILGVRTLTFSIFDTWLNRSSLAGAAQIACILLILVALLLVIERRSRGTRQYHAKGGVTLQPQRIRLSGWKSLAAAVFCALPPAAGFVAPVILLCSYAGRRLEQVADPALWSALANSLAVSLSTALITVLISLFLISAHRMEKSRVTGIGCRVAALGYAAPGSVLALGALYAFSGFDNSLDALMREYFSVSTGLLISGSMAIIILACSIRFIAIAQGAIESGYSRLSPHLPMAARTLGRSRLGAAVAVELPLLKSTLATAGLLVFVDTMKELSATILLRPFNFQTLATFVYERASRALFEDAALAALMIVVVGIVPVVLLSRTSPVTHAKIQRE
ncbi:MAG: iron ABC transporter permease [Nitratireductor sp.]|nr:iron ABC transporter permease [Nitratireductor sp.]